MAQIKLTDIARVQSMERFKQPILFDGLTCNRIYPTDIDAVMEYHDWFFMFMEVKVDGVELNRGQTTALVRMVNAIRDSGKTAVLFICRHNVDKDKSIFLKDTVVSEAYYEGGWYDLTPRTMQEIWDYAMDWAQRKEQNSNDSVYPFN